MSKKLLKISLDGKNYPCRATMGALLRFKRETGREVTEIDSGSVSDVLTYLWCCVASACNADGIDFDYSLDDFADRCNPDDVAAWSASLSEDVREDGKKKT